MKQLLAVIFLLIGAGTALAMSVADSKHNLSVTGTGVHSTTATLVCSFCHNVHNAMGGAIWGRPLPADPSVYQLYVFSPTLTPAAASAQLDGTSLSLLCLSCHGGTLESLGPNMVDTFGTWYKSGVNWDGKTPVNHPIGFDYALAQAQSPTKLGDPVQVSAALGSTTVFFKSSSSTSSMECSSCHLVHDNANPPFLRIANTGNAFCLACHIDKRF